MLLSRCEKGHHRPLWDEVERIDAEHLRKIPKLKYAMPQTITKIVVTETLGL